MALLGNELKTLRRTRKEGRRDATHRMPPLGGPGKHPPSRVCRRQVFGLANVSPFADLLLAAASQSGWISALLRFSRFAYRCGAAPDSHRIPSYAPISAPATKAAYDVVHDGVNTKYCG